MSRFLAALFATSLVFAPAAFADGNSSGNTSLTAIDTMAREVDKLDVVVETVIPIAIGSMVFGAGALLVKRFVYS